ncbi:hypothetical protein [uncultured Paludibaculum sp.]|uniref:hypothetical protein n=1 Tax=uncultured Paludibaculum sp. TaxID=1765020 RepID=UPI002AAB7AF4|nr:hypothetical protein [uncultured Paludibaculum sp.]
MRTSRWWIAVLGMVLATGAWGQTFGKVVALGGASADLALDESRGVLYVANFTANRIDVVSTQTGALTRSINVASQPSSLSISPDGRYLVVGHYGNFASPSTPKNALSVIDLDSRAKQTFALSAPPFGVAFGIDGQALVVTSKQFLLFDPELGTMLVLDTIAGVAAKTLPQPPANFPTEIVGASVQASGDGLVIHGVTDTILFTYDVSSRTVYSSGYVSEPALGPRAISVSRDGSHFLAGWAMFDRVSVTNQFPDPSGLLNIGSHAIDSDRGLVYAEIPQSTSTTDSDSGSGSGGGTSTGNTPDTTLPDPVMMIADADNLAVRERVKLPEHLAGKGILSSDGSMMYALSESGIMMLPVGNLAGSPRVVTAQEDLVFRSSFCNPGVVTKELTIVDPSGAQTDFSLSTTTAGISISPSSGKTPMTVKVAIDPSSFQNQHGTLSATIKVKSRTAVNIPSPVRVLINLQDPDQRGTLQNVPGTLVDVLADPFRNRFFVLRQDTNQVLVFDGSNYTQLATLRTGNTPMSMALTFDRKYLMVGNDNSQYANVYDLETLEQLNPIRFPFGHYPRSLAASANGILAATRVAGPKNTIDRVDFFSRTATELPSLGVFENSIALNTALVASANGSSILAAESDGNVLLYSANSGSFTISRQDFTSLGGAYAASSFDQFVVGTTLFNASLVPVAEFDTAVGNSSGFAFLDQTGYRTGATDSASPGVIQRVDLSSGVGKNSTRMVEAPILGTTGAVFTRSLAVLPDRSALVNLTTSGFTILAWNYDASVAIPQIDNVVNAADKTSAVAPGGLIIVRGTDLSPTNLATKEVPLPTALGESCLSVNGLSVPMLMVSPTQINAQLPFQAEGNVTMVLRTPGGVSDNYNLTVLPTAPSVFRIALAEDYEVPQVVRSSNGMVVSPSNPVRSDDDLVIYLTGMGITNPEIPAGTPAPADAPVVLTDPTVSINGYSLPVAESKLVSGQVGVYEIKVHVPFKVPKGMNQTMLIQQGGYSSSVNVRVID